MKKTYSDTNGSNKQSGFALIEVLVSMILLAIGIVALLTTQIRSVAGVREAEGQSVIANAAQNLIEGMLANPVVSEPAVSTTWKTKKYTAYERGITQTATDNDCASELTDEDELNKNELSNMQLCQFEQSLRSLPDAKAEFRICRDSTGAALEVSRKADGSIKWPVCDGSGDTLIQVAWQAQPEKEGDSTNGPLYAFQSRVTD